MRLSREAAAALRPEALNEIGNAMELLETTLLADGRDWILGTEGPSLADIEAVWPFHWLVGLPGALPPDQVSAERFPRVYAWVARFQGAVTAAKAKQPRPRDVSGEEAQRTIVEAPYHEPGCGIDETEPVVGFHGLRKGSAVAVWPTDTGSSYKDTGRLVGLNSKEIVLETETKTEARGQGVRLHAPRHGFRIRPSPNAASSL